MSRLTSKFLGLTVAVALFAVAATAGAQTVQPRVAIQLLTSGLTSPLVASSTDNVMARLVVDTTGSPEAVRLSSLPFILATGNGAASGTLQNCTVVNEANTGADLSANSGGLVAGLNSINLTSPLVLAAGTVTTLQLRCDTTGGLVSGGTFTFSMNTANVAGTGVSTGLPAIVTVRGAVPTVPVIPVIPTVPNTGAGGDVAQNVALLLGSITLATLGIAYTRKAAAQAR
jgi:hypothetical protein